MVKDIRTGLFTDAAFNMLQMLIGYRCYDRLRQYTKINRLDDGEVVIHYDTSTNWGHYRNPGTNITTRFNSPDAKILQWFAVQLKKIATNGFDRDLVMTKWSRYCGEQCSRFEGQFRWAEIYLVYDAIQKRNDVVAKHYSESLIKKMVGSQLDPVEIEMRSAKKQEIASIEDWYNGEINRIDKEMDAELREWKMGWTQRWYDVKEKIRDEKQRRISLVEQMARA